MRSLRDTAADDAAALHAVTHPAHGSVTLDADAVGSLRRAILDALHTLAAVEKNTGRMRERDIVKRRGDALRNTLRYLGQ